MARTEIAHLHAERERYEETMKKAFMRGVCALNLEAMSMFREGEEGGRRPPPAAAAAVNDNGAISHLGIYKIWFIVFGITMDSDLFKNSWIKNLISEVLDLFYLKMMLRQIRELPEMSVNSHP